MAAQGVVGNIEIPTVLTSLEQEAGLGEALPASKFAAIKYEKIQFDENYNSGSMDLQSFDKKALQSCINHGGVVD